jgi:hypothetical protein
MPLVESACGLAYTHPSTRRSGLGHLRQIKSARDGSASPSIAPELMRRSKPAKGQQKTLSATLTCEDGNGNAIYSKSIEYTDFPLPEIALYFTNSVFSRSSVGRWHAASGVTAPAAVN